MSAKELKKVTVKALSIMLLMSTNSYAGVVVMQKQNTAFSIDGSNGARQGQQAYLYQTNIENVNQQWVETSVGSDYVSYQKQNTSVCLDGGQGARNRQAVTLETCDANDEDQHWKKVSVENGTFRLEKRGTGFSIDGKSGAQNRQTLHLWTSNNDNVNQQWELFDQEGPTSDNNAPTVSFVTLGDNNSFDEGQRVNVTVNADDSNGDITSVSLSIDNNFVRTERLAPYGWGANDAALQNLSPGTYRLTAVAEDNDGLTNQASTTITVVSEPTQEKYPESFNHNVTFNGETVTINLTKFSNRGPLFSVVEQQVDGEFIELDVSGDIQTYMGLVEGHPNAFANGMIKDNGEIWTNVIFPNTTTWRDVNGEVTESARDFGPSLPTEFLNQKAGSDIHAADIHLDISYSQIQASGGTTVDAIEMVELSMNSINIIYLRDAAVLNRIGKIILRNDLAKDPYASITTSAEGLAILRAQAANEVKHVDPSLDHDLAAVISNNVGGGLAGVGVVGTGYSYTGSWNDGDFTNVGRHEFGHNWGLPHYPGGQHVENKTIMSGNGLSKFASAGVSRLVTHRNSRATQHLDKLGKVAPPLPPRAADDIVYIDSSQFSVSFNPLNNDNDVNGENIRIHSVPEKTIGGLNVSFNDNEIIFINPEQYTGQYDYIYYTIVDESGLQSTANIHIQPPTPQSPPASSQRCASENETCTIPTGFTATIWYGARDSWAVLTNQSGNISCSNARFGDPISGVAKNCEYILEPLTATNTLIEKGTALMYQSTLAKQHDDATDQNCDNHLHSD